MVKAKIKFNIYNSADNKIYKEYNTFYCKRKNLEDDIQLYIEEQYNDCDYEYFGGGVYGFYYNKYAIIVTYEIIETVIYKMDNLIPVFIEACNLYNSDKLNRFVYDFEDEKFKINVSDIRQTILDLTDDIYYFKCFNADAISEDIYKYFE